ncbi:hypothetical protein [Shinella sp.]|uniref:hypothetical protein n=1 Tax=Shinella sp. TaxID=1870904 RepID=UPI0028AA5C89|nr:hypothetical protein [Shinella sp.]
MSLKSKYEDLPSNEIRRRMRELDLHSGTTLKRPPTEHDPILTTVFYSFFNVTLGFSAVTSGILASAATALATTTVTPGLQVHA